MLTLHVTIPILPYIYKLQYMVAVKGWSERTEGSYIPSSVVGSFHFDMDTDPTSTDLALDPKNFQLFIFIFFNQKYNTQNKDVCFVIHPFKFYSCLLNKKVIYFF